MKKSKSNCEGLVGSPNRRDADHCRILYAEMRLTILCIELAGCGGLETFGFFGENKILKTE